MVALLSLVIMVIVLGGIVAATEAALFTVPHARARFLAEEGGAGKVLLGLKESMSEPIATLTAFSSLITVVGSVYSGAIAAGIFGSDWVGLFAAVLTVIIMVLGEIIPKRFGERY